MQLTVEKIKDWRLRIDTLANSTKILNPSREVSLVLTNLQRGKMWLGQVLKHMDTPNPYPESKNPESPVIEKQTEHTDTDFISIPNGDQTAHVKLYRSKISEITDELEEIFFPKSKLPVLEFTNQEECEEHGRKDSLLRLSLSQAYVSLTDATMWLGMQLNNIRENPILNKTYTLPTNTKE